MDRNSSWICFEELVVVPSVTTAAAIEGAPGCSSRPVARPTGKLKIAVTFGIFGKGATMTSSPFESFFSEIFGKFKGRCGPGGGAAGCVCC